MKKKNEMDLNGIMKGVLPNIIVVIVILALSWVVKAEGLLPFLLIVLVAVLGHKLYDEVFKKVKPRLTGWLRSIGLTLAFSVVIYYLYHWLKGYGLLGLAVLVLVFAAYRVYKGRVLFMRTAKFIGGRLK